MFTLPGDLERRLRLALPTFWPNPHLRPASPGLAGLEFTHADLRGAEQRLSGVAPWLVRAFPELTGTGGRLWSPLRRIAAIDRLLLGPSHHDSMWLKCDHELPVAGSVKARGALHELLHVAGSIGREAGHGADCTDPPGQPFEPAHSRLEQTEIIVGSTGNLGLSIGLFARAFGFRATVHMSSDARPWKKRRLQDVGVRVVEHRADYTHAVAAGRAAAAANPHAWFVDDENSRWLFLGYAVAALQLKQQLDDAAIRIDADHPLFVYIPCGVGGAPGGICFGLRHVFGDDVYCFFAEPVQSPSMLLALAAGLAVPPSVHELGLSNVTQADGLAVGRASALVARNVRHLVAGCFTVADETLFEGLHELWRSERVRVEPSAAAALPGPSWLTRSPAGRSFLRSAGLEETHEAGTHVVWSTGGALLPAAEFEAFELRGRAIARLGSRTLLASTD